MIFVGNACLTSICFAGVCGTVWVTQNRDLKFSRMSWILVEVGNQLLQVYKLTPMDRATRDVTMPLSEKVCRPQVGACYVKASSRGVTDGDECGTQWCKISWNFAGIHGNFQWKFHPTSLCGLWRDREDLSLTGMRQLLAILQGGPKNWLVSLR